MRKLTSYLFISIDGVVEAPFINNTPKFVVSSSLKTLEWRQSTLVSGRLEDEIAALKAQPGKAIGAHGSISLVQSLLIAGLLDEMRFVLVPAVVGCGRRLLSREGDPIQLNLQSTRTTPSGPQYITYSLRSS